MRVLPIGAGALQAEVLDRGAILRSLIWLGRPMVLSAPELNDYHGAWCYSGAVVGRVANRIRGERFELDGVTYAPDRNQQGRHTLHGGADGLHAQTFEVEDVTTNGITLSCVLPDGHMGFPGALWVEVCYEVSGSALSVQISAETTASTPASIAPHPLFNLDGGGSVAEHRLQVPAGEVLELDHEGIPTGQILDVTSTEFDLRDGGLLGGRLLDVNYCFAPGTTGLVARLEGGNRQVMEVQSNTPGLQVYDCATFDPAPFGAVALEPQGWPDAVNHRHFPNVILRPGQKFLSATSYCFK